ncbi:3-oxoacyl-ACP synthase [Mucilaginibacter myungsuensis]|uniref:3-oxoacyl-ACP synthase n=1 Tax=Mucilaginibacter myungsuensis TaxID=649104 RepID=A0A929KUH9_9SPHI|nr:3-oxoacyl-ACP synthase [Mucilaginibacter myungsuensis]MBE9661022.1 3-oxoacyl-ACP synthase [Mucilaginibacter myungsuensis]MDN3597166.1 3-oxoacyl-ACP synthase [Mucilaginibacter myungsuensis]
MSQLKEQLHQLCTQFVQERMDNARQAILSAEQSAAQDTKSSAGDKYETGREMLQQEKDRGMAQLTEANKLLIALNRVSTAGTSTKIEEGSVVRTNNGNFYIAISAGVIKLGDESFFAISAASPIGAKMQGCKAGDEFVMNGKGYMVTEVV